MSDSDEYTKLYALLSSLSSKTKDTPSDELPKAAVPTPMVDLMKGTVTTPMKTLVLDIPPLEDTPSKPRPPTPPLRIEPQNSEKITPIAAITEPGDPVVTPNETSSTDDLSQNEFDEIMLKSFPRSKTIFTCEACLRTFPTSGNLQTHFKISPMCTHWFNLPNKELYDFAPKPIHLWMDDMLSKAITTEEQPLQCRYCHTSFSNKGNLHKHYYSAVICNRLAFARLKTMMANLK
jgi:uncharacterized Zn-finger protein